MESAAYQYDDPAYLARQCVKASEVLGIEPSRTNWVRIATIINEGLPDLYRMPSEPVRERKGKEFGELKVMADGKQIAAEGLTIEGKGRSMSQLEPRIRRNVAPGENVINEEAKSFEVAATTERHPLDSEQSRKVLKQCA